MAKAHGWEVDAEVRKGLPAMDLTGVVLYQKYAADRELQAQRRLWDEVIDERPFEALYAEAGRPAWPVGVLIRACLLQREKGWHDRQLVAEMQDNQRVRYLVGLPVGVLQVRAPCRSVLSDFRRRVVAAGLQKCLLEQQVGWIVGQGLIDPAGDDFALDATRQESAAAQPTVIGLLQHGMRRVLLAWRLQAPVAAEAAAERIRIPEYLAKRFQRCAHGLRSRAGRRLWRKAYRQAERLLELLPDKQGAALGEAVGLLRQVMAERGPDGTNRPPDRLTNVVDPDARFGCKGQGSHLLTWQGYRVSLLSHCPTDLIVDFEHQAASHGEPEVLPPMLRRATDLLGGVPGRTHADGAYTGCQSRRTATGLGTDLVGPRRGRRQRGRVPGGGHVASRADRGVRAEVERVHAHLVRWRHNRRSWYLRQPKAALQTALSCCAANFVRLLSLLRRGELTLAGPPAAA